MVISYFKKTSLTENEGLFWKVIIDPSLCKVLELESLLWVEGYNYRCFYILWVTWEYTLISFSEIARLILITHCVVDGLRLRLSPTHVVIQMTP